MEAEITKVNPKELKLLEINARYMERQEFQRLVQNIKKDGRLTTVPFGHRKECGTIEILSGNHRVMASIEAGLDEIEIMVSKDPLSHDKQVAIQLSHNAIVGKDDNAILNQLLNSIQTKDLKEYSAISEESLADYNKFINELKVPNFNYQVFNLLFAPEEISEIKNFLEYVEKMLGKNEKLIASFKHYDTYIELTSDVSKSLGVKNSATVFMAILELAKRNIEQLKHIWLESAKPNNYVPISTIIGRTDIKKSDAIILDKAVNLLLSRGKIKKKGKEEVLKYLSEFYMTNA
ncbi:MAG: ParB/RepB/Spo0J family partition protein [Firmicutes bacterium]|nr:ParB/RepB/Spo0J family partition protein [Bacillota bacterium]